MFSLNDRIKIKPEICLGINDKNARGTIVKISIIEKIEFYGVLWDDIPNHVDYYYVDELDFDK
jgi:hypothetical protein